MDAPFCKLCQTKHPLGHHTAFTSSRGAARTERKSPAAPAPAVMRPAKAQGATATASAAPRETPTETSHGEVQNNDRQSGGAMRPKRHANASNRNAGDPGKPDRPRKVKAGEQRAGAATARVPSGRGKKSRSNKIAAVKVKRGRPAKEDEGKTLTDTKPWLALQMSRATYYRLAKKQRKKRKAKKKAKK